MDLLFCCDVIHFPNNIQISLRTTKGIYVYYNLIISMLPAILTYHLSVLAMIHTASETGSSTTECCKKEPHTIVIFSQRTMSM